MPSISGFINGTQKRFSTVKYGDRIYDKLDLLVFALLNSFPRSLRNKSIVERIFHTLQPSLKGKVICVNGTKYVLVDDESLYIVIPDFELWMWNYLKPEEGDIFLDVGAHVGKYTLQTAKIVGEKGLVIAVEPMPENYETLTRNITLNNLRNVISLNIAAWNSQSNLKLFIGDKHGHNSVKYDMDLGCVGVKAEALDVVLEEVDVSQVNWIKIDVEGAEYEVLQGLKNTLKRSVPKVVVEVWNENEHRILAFMRKLNYEIFPIIDSKSKRACYYYFEKKHWKTFKSRDI